MSEEDQLAFAKACFMSFVRSFGSSHDIKGYEGNGCFIPLGDGRYMDIIWEVKDSKLICDPIRIYESDSYYDDIMYVLKDHAYLDRDSRVVEFKNESYKGQDVVHNTYTGFAPVVYNGKIKAVILLRYNYDSFAAKINHGIGIIVAALIILCTGVCFAFIRRTKKIAAKPITAIQNAVREYIETRDVDNARSKLENIYSGNEIGVLAEDIDQMIVEISDHIGEVEKAGKKHKILMLELMEALASAIDAKDSYTNGHSRRVAEYSRKIAMIAGKSEEECEKVYFAALLHDVGKIGVPIEILTKKGRLTDEEFAYIKQHPVQGSQILSKITDYPWLSIGAKYHHERYDGKGYPEGLSGEDIPEIARIIAVADAYDAMTSNRSYRDAIPQHIVREELVKGINAQFDPEFVGIMIRMLDLDIEYKMKERVAGTNVSKKKEIRCETIGNDCSEGIGITTKKIKVSFYCRKDEDVSEDIAIPTLILFDSLDGKVHPGQENNKDLLYFDYARIRLDGEVDNYNLRKFEIRDIEPDEDRRWHKEGQAENDHKYIVEAYRNHDHIWMRVLSEKRSFDVILALPDTSRYAYISITGECCDIHKIRIDVAEEKSDLNSIPRICEEISYIKDCPVGDIPNIQIHGPRMASTEGVLILGTMTLTFHTMSYPISRLVWHCPYFSIYTSEDGKVNGKDYREFLLLKMDGENWEPDESVKSEVVVNKTDNFKGWNEWMESNKQGLDYTTTIIRNDDQVIIHTENSGIVIDSITTIPAGTENVYLSITGDQCAITNIKLK